MDIATLLGLGIAVLAVLGTILMEGGDPASYASPSAALIILGGTLATTLINFPLPQVLKLPKLIAKTMFGRSHDHAAIIELIVKMVDRARREGLLSLEQMQEELPDDFMRKGVLLVVDGTQPELVRSIMENEIAALEERHKAGYGMLEAMGGYSPTLGIIGTVLGLVIVLSHLEDPSELGHSIAVAFIATLMGVAFANLLWLPMAGKLKYRSKEEVALRELALEGLTALQAGENPRVVRQKLEAFLSPQERRAAAKAAEEPQPDGATERRPVEAVS